MKGCVSMPLVKEKLYTIEDIYGLPDGTRAELINGHIYYMSPPSRNHQKIVSKLNQKIANYIDSHDGSCEVYPAPFAVFLEKDHINYVEPDLYVICDKDKLDDKGCHGAPDWIIEVVSLSSRRMDYSIKLFKYRTAGVREYWIIDVEKNRIMVHDLSHEDIHEYTFNDSVPAGIYEDLVIDFNQFNL